MPRPTDRHEPPRDAEVVLVEHLERARQPLEVPIERRPRLRARPLGAQHRLVAEGLDLGEVVVDREEVGRRAERIVLIRLQQPLDAVDLVVDVGEALDQVDDLRKVPMDARDLVDPLHALDDRPRILAQPLDVHHLLADVAGGHACIAEPGEGIARRLELRRRALAQLHLDRRPLRPQLGPHRLRRPRRAIQPRAQRRLERRRGKHVGVAA